MGGGLKATKAYEARVLASAFLPITRSSWLGNKLDASKRSQSMFMDRDDILNLFVVTNLLLPSGALSEMEPSDYNDLGY